MTLTSQLVAELQQLKSQVNQMEKKLASHLKMQNQKKESLHSNSVEEILSSITTDTDSKVSLKATVATSCLELSAYGNTANGLFMVKKGKQDALSVVLCDFGAGFGNPGKIFTHYHLLVDR